MAPLADHVHRTALQALDSISADERAGIYVVSFFVYDEEDDPRRPTMTVGFNTEDDVAGSMDATHRWSPDEREARWNFACWRQNQLVIVCDSNADPVGAALREAWARENGLWYDLAEGEDPAFDERGEPLTEAFVELLVGVVGRLHGDGDIQRIFGESIPVLIHELEYYEEIAAQNLAANPAGVISDDFVAWCRE